MNMIQQQQQSAPGEVQRRPNRIFAFILHVLIPVLALGCGVAITIYLMKTAPQAKPRKRPPTPTLVEVQQIATGPQQTIVTAMGEVIPAREIDLKPRVSGAVTITSEEFLPGGFFLAGETLMNIDPADYNLVLQQLESEADRARSDLLLEMGNQRIAAREFQLLGEQVSPEEQALILRKPQLAKLEATVSAAEAKLAQARLDLERTRVTAPFNSVVSEKNVETGAHVTQSTILAHLVGTDTFWLNLSLPVEQLQWLHIPTGNEGEGSVVRIYPQGAGDKRFRTGKVIRLSAALESQGRMAQLLVEVDDPLCLKEENHSLPKLLLGSYVRAELEGRTIPSAASVNRAHLRDGDTIWLMDAEGQLEIRNVKVLFRNRDQVIIENGFEQDEFIITSALASPVAGIPLNRASEAEPGQKETRAQGAVSKDGANQIRKGNPDQEQSRGEGQQ